MGVTARGLIGRDLRRGGCEPGLCRTGAFQARVVAPYVAATSLGQDGTRTGWLQEGHDGFDWVSTAFRAGDVAIFGLDLFHTTLPNRLSALRVSADIRFMPAGDDPDPRSGKWY